MSAVNKGRKRKTEGNDTEVEKGTRIKSLFKDGIWYEIGAISKIIKGKGGELVRGCYSV